MSEPLRIEVVMAWPDRCQSRQLVMGEGATVADAVAQAALDTADTVVAYAIHGLLASAQQVLRDGDRVELLRPLLADPKENRRRRANAGS
ncbi:RnfH family protein [Stenotrophomonas sp. YIM B06876]|uniref:RnfH family protein n=1 Tax=Stenotrophomonas sp. YIM B06876 TaxID=3060211 RepID=UPI002739B0D0|nr:RnfH family protein [Stenotrophomonas sp. YIM B06876]